MRGNVLKENLAMRRAIDQYSAEKAAAKWSMTYTSKFCGRSVDPITERPNGPDQSESESDRKRGLRTEKPSDGADATEAYTITRKGP